MAKKKKKTQAQKRSDSFIRTKEALKAGKIVTIDRDAIINLPILGAFRDYISEALNYIFSQKSEEETIKVLAHIRDGFKDVPKDAPYDGYMNSVWCLMTLLTEINHQAAQQGHTIITEENFDESLSNLINSMEIGTMEHSKQAFKDVITKHKNKKDIKSNED
tara:strand:+ start:582 stop:1067 length:486 start_codon:yes stop_codon:yes gene_type:complete